MKRVKLINRYLTILQFCEQSETVKGLNRTYMWCGKYRRFRGNQGESLYEQGLFKPAVIKTNNGFITYFERERDIALLEELQNFFFRNMMYNGDSLIKTLLFPCQIVRIGEESGYLKCDIHLEYFWKNNS